MDLDERRPRRGNMRHFVRLVCRCCIFPINRDWSVETEKVLQIAMHLHNSEIAESEITESRRFSFKFIFRSWRMLFALSRTRIISPTALLCSSKCLHGHITVVSFVEWTIKFNIRIMTRHKRPEPHTQNAPVLAETRKSGVLLSR